MKFILRSVLSLMTLLPLGIMILSVSSVTAQSTSRPGSLPYGSLPSLGDYAPVGSDGRYANPMTGQRYNNAFAATMSRINSENQQLTSQLINKIQIYSAIGAEVISAGKATTTIPPTNYQGKDSVTTYGLKEFNKELQLRGLKQTDMADCRTLMLALSYEVYINGIRANQKQLATTRKLFYQALQSDTFYQGLPIAERVKDYERYAVQTMLAYRIWQSGKQGQQISAEDNEQAIESSKAVIKRFWKGGAAALTLSSKGFEDVSEATLLATGTTTFQRTSQSLIAEEKRRVHLDALADIYDQRIQEFDQLVQSYGSQTNDFAAANAVAFVIYFKIYTGTQLNQAQYQWLLKEMIGDIKKDTSFQSARDQVRQQKYEQLASTAMFLANNKLQTESQIKSTAYQQLKQIFAPRNLEAYALTPTGFTKK